MKTICFSVQKGGTGKTSVSVSAAVQLARSGKKILLVDADPQGNATTWLNFEEIGIELADVLSGKNSIHQAITETKEKNLYAVLTAGIGGSLSSVKDSMSGKELFCVLDILDEIRDQFDFCIIDTSPSFTAMEKRIVAAADEVIPVFNNDGFSFDGFEIFSNNLKDFKKGNRLSDKPEVKTLVINRYSKNLVVDKLLYEQFRKYEKEFNLITFPTDEGIKKSQVAFMFAQDYGIKEQTQESLIELIKCMGA